MADNNGNEGKSADEKEIIEYLTSVMRGEAVSEIVVTEHTGKGCSSAKLLDKRPAEREKLKAAELLGKRFAIFSGKANKSGQSPVVIKGGDALED